MKYTIEGFREPDWPADHLSGLADIESGPVASASIDVLPGEVVDLHVPGVYITATTSAAVDAPQVVHIERLLQASHRVLEVARREGVFEAVTLLEDRIRTFENALRNGAP